MYKHVNALGKRATSIFLAAVLATGLIPAGALAFADEAVEENTSTEYVASDVTTNETQDTQSMPAGTEDDTFSSEATSDAASSASVAASNRVNESVDITGNSSSSVASDASSNPSTTTSVDENATQTPVKESTDTTKPVYTYNGQDRISVDIPMKAEQPITLGDIEYKGLTYRIGEDGKTATLIGLGSAAADENIVVPSQISTGEKLLQVTAISAKGRMSDEALAGLDPYTVEFYSLEEKAESVKAITIPTSVENINLAFFQLFPNLKNIEVTKGNNSYTSFNGILFDSEKANLLLVPEG